MMDTSSSPLFALILALLQLVPVFYAMTALQSRPPINLTMSLCLLAVTMGALIWTLTGLTAFAVVYLGTLGTGLAVIWGRRLKVLA